MGVGTTLLVISAFGVAAVAFAAMEKEKNNLAGKNKWGRKDKIDELRKDKNAYQQRKVLTRTEVVFYQRLIAALPECLILAQVSLSSVVEVKEHLREAKAFLYQINQKSLDYVICLPDFTVVAVIELDDWTHKRRDRVKADKTKDEVLAVAGVPIIRWHAEEMPSVEEIRRAIV